MHKLFCNWPRVNLCIEMKCLPSIAKPISLYLHIYTHTMVSGNVSSIDDMPKWMRYAQIENVYPLDLQGGTQTFRNGIFIDLYRGATFENRIVPPYDMPKTIFTFLRRGALSLCERHPPPPFHPTTARFGSKTLANWCAIWLYKMGSTGRYVLCCRILSHFGELAARVMYAYSILAKPKAVGIMLNCLNGFKGCFRSDYAILCVVRI